MNLDQWLAKIEAFHPCEIDLGLTRVSSLALELDLLETSAKIITVGGTNGKGSTVATLESLALDSELSIGCYTSPHLLRFNERVRINGSDVEDQKLITAFEQIEEVRTSLSHSTNEVLPITFFEFTTLVALLIFKSYDLELIVLEVGLGGRLDAVNIMNPDVAIITTIALDHQSWLGNNLESIALEKSGIFRNTSHNFIGDRDSFDLISKVRNDLSAQFLEPDPQIVRQLELVIDKEKVNPNRLLKTNLAVAFSAFCKLFKRCYQTKQIAKVLTEICIKGRFQKVFSSPTIIADVAHNEQAGQNLSSQLMSLKCAGKRIAICGMMADKSMNSYLAALDNVIDRWVFVDLPIKRAASAQQLLTIAETVLKHADSIGVGEIPEILGDLRSQFSSQDLVLITGSFITLAEAIPIIETQN